MKGVKIIRRGLNVIEIRGGKKRVYHIHKGMHAKGFKHLFLNQKQSPETANTMATKTAAKKTAPKKAVAKKAAKKEGPGKIEQIIALHKQGKSNQEIVDKGFNKTTVSIQVGKFKREKADKKAAKA